MMFPYFYNCKKCGRPLIYKSVSLTESTRRSGYCVSCALKVLEQKYGRVLLAPRPTQDARLN